MEKKLTDINFFICSTFIDLRGYRNEVIKRIQSQAGLINAQEFFGARDKKPIDTCLKEVEQSNVFIMIIGFRFGSIDRESGKYFIEIEYEKAKELNLPKFIYFLDDENPFPPKYIAINEEAHHLLKFKAKLREDHTIQTVTSTEDFANKVIADLLRELPEKGFKIGRKKKENKEENTITILKKFLALPKIYYGSEVELKVKLGDLKRTPMNECEAFSFRYGASVKRKIEVVSPIFENEYFPFEYIYSDEENAVEFISLPMDEIVTLKLKTIQGTEYIETPIYEIHNASDLIDDPRNSQYYQLRIFDTKYGKKIRVETGSKRDSQLICGLEYVTESTEKQYTY